MWNEPSRYTLLSLSDTFHSSGTGVGVATGVAADNGNAAARTSAVNQAWRMQDSSGSMFGVDLLSRDDGEIEPVRGRRQRTGGVRRERAGRVLAVVEIDLDAAVGAGPRDVEVPARGIAAVPARAVGVDKEQRRDRKSTRLNSSHSQISYAVF